MCRPLAVSTLAAALVATIGATAHARIACDEGYQKIRGDFISTPYCQDEQVADVARQYGVRTSGAAIRNNPGHKREICRLIGRDNRVQQACIDAFSSGRGSR
ncbi:MAG: hypothetical protein K2Y05_03380 [Hyphomicrobiaceae bacterium]|nr:hypothetical protein [Hyphomicrobiaceae bacterium]